MEVETAEMEETDRPRVVKEVDFAKLGARERQNYIDNLIRHIESDNIRLLQKQKDRMDRVKVKQPTIEVRYQNLCVDADCTVVEGKPLPTLWNSFKDLFSTLWTITGLMKSQEAKIRILKNVTGIIKPSRLTLLLGPPGCGKTTFLLALAGNLDKSLNVTGEISYNGYRLEEFVQQRTASYVSQYDLHIPEMTVRETIDFSARCQGVGSRYDIMKEVIQREKEEGIVPDQEIDTYMTGISLNGLKKNIQTDYIMKIIALDICANTIVGDAMRIGISGGQKKRLTTAEMIVGPTKAIFLDEISTGLDTSTTFQIVKHLQQVGHILETTLLVSLLQPTPETYELFDDVILMAEGKVVYHGPCSHVVHFFYDCGFKCPERKGTADFLQEVISRKDQKQYWNDSESRYEYVSVDNFCQKFKEYHIGYNLEKEISKPFAQLEHHKKALSYNIYSLPKWQLFKACMSRELLLMKRNSFVYIFKTTQLMVNGFTTMTLFIRTRMEIDLRHSAYYMGALFFAIILLMVNGFPELSMTVSRLPGFYKQRDLHFYPAWAYSIPATILKIPISFIDSLGWTSMTYYVIGYSPEIGRFFSHFLLLFALHQMALALFRFIAALFKEGNQAYFAGVFVMFVLFLFGGFILPQPSLPGWLSWGFWICPLSYAEIGISVNEFLAPRWQKSSSSNVTIAKQVLRSRGLDYPSYFYWISLASLLGFTLLFNVGFSLALTYLRAPGRHRAIISREKLFELERGKNLNEDDEMVKTDDDIKQSRKARGKIILPFQPLTISFQEINYYVDAPKQTKETKLQLLHGVTGSFRPGVLAALMGLSGAGKTTLMDVLCGRKTGGIIEGEIRINGYLKAQETFARISGYCEQTDIHSPHITVEESLIFSAWLRLPSEIDSNTRTNFVNDVLEIIELDGIKDAIVGLPGINGLSTEQRKRLTIAVELVSNPAIIFMDEPTSGLDARAAAIVVRAVKNISATGRTVVCTIHQPGIEIFETFDEVVLMKSGKLIYSGILGEHSSAVIDYFEGISGIPRIKDNQNPATWMLHVSTTMEMELGIDFSSIYKDSSMCKKNLEVVRELSTPKPGAIDLNFPTHFAQSSWVQFKVCLWKKHLSYWRSPSYTFFRLILITLVSITIAAVFWQKGTNLNNEQDLFNILGSLYISTLMAGINSCSTAIPYIATERSVLYREKFAGMYSSWIHSFAQMTIEMPYSFAQAIIFMIIGYPGVGYYMTVRKFLWFFYVKYFSILYFSYLGMFIVSITPNAQVALILASTFYTNLNLFAGFVIPGRQIPKWWIWLYYIMPTSWTLNGFFTSQYGDIKKEIIIFGETKQIDDFLNDYFGFKQSGLPLVAIMILVNPIIVGSLFAYFIGRLNFQKR